MIRDGLAHLTVGASQPNEALELATTYLTKRGWIVGTAEVVGNFRPRVGVMGYRAWRVEVPVWR